MISSRRLPWKFPKILFLFLVFSKICKTLENFSLYHPWSLQLHLGLEGPCELPHSIVKLAFIFHRLKRFDESTVVSRKGSQAPTPPLSVKGIGNKGSDFFRSFVLCLIVPVISCETRLFRIKDSTRDGNCNPYRFTLFSCANCSNRSDSLQEGNHIWVINLWSTWRYVPKVGMIYIYKLTTGLLYSGWNTTLKCAALLSL